jgi:NAD(P)-dependent dehydrogenase (short-subunit alcohol dehydrogenase family)
MPRTVLIVGATRGLGKSLLDQYAAEKEGVVYGTARNTPPQKHDEFVKWIGDVDLSTEQAGLNIVAKYEEDAPFDILVLTAGYFGLESFEKPDWEKELMMYKTSAMGPVFLVHHLVHAGLLKKGSKIILVSSESGSIALRHETEGGGNYGHHASKAAENMVGKLLSLDLKDKGIAVALVHPGFMKTEMTAGVGFDKYWEDGGAVTPDVAATSLIKWINTFDLEKTGTYWAPRGPA